MSFVSFAFLCLFLCTFLWIKMVKRERTRQRILLLASFVFYAWWDWRFLFLLLAEVAVVYFCGIGIETRKHKKCFLVLSISICLTILVFFKYFNFFLNTFMQGFHIQNVGALPIILPVGISFYTFQAISYVADVYKGAIRAEYQFGKVCLYICFFPQLVAGPIVRASEFLPQLEREHPIQKENVTWGLQVFLFGIIKKIVIADRLSVCVDAVWNSPMAYNGAALLCAVISYMIQIYCDFSGYSDMAIGVAKIFGYDLTRNFNLPYASKNPTEFWRRWHISLSEWLRDYLYIPLGGNRKGKVHQYCNLMITMLLGGLWHGASWTFVFWGLYHGIALVLHKIAKPYLRIKGKIWDVISIILNNIFVAIGWIFFRSQSMGQAWSIIRGIFIWQSGISYIYVYTICYGLLVLGCCIWAYTRNSGNGFYPVLKLNRFWEKVLFACIVWMVLLLFYSGNAAFIYFQF